MDRLDFTAVFRQYRESVLNMAEAIVGDRDAAEDVAQEVWIKLLECATSPVPSTALVPWLRVVTQRTAFDHMRRERRSRARESDWVDSDVGDDSGESCTDEAIITFLAARISSLPAKQMAVIRLRAIDGLSTAETAQALGVADGTVRATLTQVRKRLQDAWSDERRRGGDAPT